MLRDKTSHIFGSDTMDPSSVLHDPSVTQGKVQDFKDLTYNLSTLVSDIRRPAKNVLLIIDSCNSGTIDDNVAISDSSSNPVDDMGYNPDVSHKERLLTRTQQYLTSASKEDADDASFGNRDNSPFADQLLNTLNENAEAGTILTFSGLWKYFRRDRFHKDQKHVEQTPHTGAWNYMRRTVIFCSSLQRGDSVLSILSRRHAGE